MRTGYVAVSGEAIEAKVKLKADHKSKTPMTLRKEPITENLYFEKFFKKLVKLDIFCFSNFKYINATGI